VLLLFNMRTIRKAKIQQETFLIATYRSNDVITFYCFLCYYFRSLFLHATYPNIYNWKTILIKTIITYTLYAVHFCSTFTWQVEDRRPTVNVLKCITFISLVNQSDDVKYSISTVIYCRNGSLINYGRIVLIKS
jgi:hypothetical protein